MCILPTAILALTAPTYESPNPTFSTAVEQFLEVKKRKNESTVENYTYILNEFLGKTSAKYIDEFNYPKSGRRIFGDFIDTLEKDGAAPKTIESWSP